MTEEEVAPQAATLTDEQKRAKDEQCEGEPEREPAPKQWAQSIQPTNYIPPGWDPLRAQAMGMTPQELWNREHGKHDPFTAPKPGFGGR